MNLNFLKTGAKGNFKSCQKEKKTIYKGKQRQYLQQTSYQKICKLKNNCTSERKISPYLKL